MVFDVVKVEHGIRVQTEPSRISRRSEFAQVTPSDRYLLPGESLLGPFARLPACHGGEAALAPRLHDRIGTCGSCRRRRYGRMATPATASPASSIGATRALAGRRPKAPGKRYSRLPVPP